LEEEAGSDPGMLIPWGWGEQVPKIWSGGDTNVNVHQKLLLVMCICAYDIAI